MSSFHSVMTSTRLVLITAIIIVFYGTAYGETVTLNWPTQSCPGLDVSKRDDIGLTGKTAAWKHCFGSFEFSGNEKSVKSFSGAWREGVPDLFGQYIFINGDTYEGDISKGALHGDGIYYYRSGAEYQGAWRNSKRNGLGVYIEPNGARTSGFWDNGKLVRHQPYEYVINLDKFVHKSVYLGSEKSDAKFVRPCPIFDQNQQLDIYRTKLWTRCWGKYTFKQGIYAVGTVYEGSWGAGRPDGKGSFSFPNGDKYEGGVSEGGLDGFGKLTSPTGATYIGEFKNGKPGGQGVFRLADGTIQIGEFVDGKLHGAAVTYSINGAVLESGIYDKGSLAKQVRIDTDIFARIPKNNFPANSNLLNERTDTERINLQISLTKPSSDGAYVISIQTNIDTASLKINGEEIGGRSDGRYTINRIARAGQDTKLDIVARDVYGNTDTKTITVNRAVVESKVTYAALNPAKVKREAERDAVAIIIGISDYRNLPKAAHADDDARAFYDYAIRALGVKPENIKLLVNQDADEIEIYKAFKTWLPSKVRKTTDVFVFYSGHGYATADGKGLYWFPHRADRDLISKTAILVEELNNDILATSPRSVTVFADACYSGQARSGETLIASARPIVPKAETRLFPESFAVITASQHDQISSSSPDLQHGIFSYYLMKGMEGEADSNRDGKITLGEMQAYLVETVTRQAAAMSRKQEPQVLGDSSRVLVGK